MATETLLNAALLRLRSALLETYATIQSTLQTRVEAGDAQTLAAKAIELAQLEMAIAVLEKNRENLITPPEEEPTVVEVEEESEEPSVSAEHHNNEAEELVKRFDKSRKFHQSKEDE